MKKFETLKKTIRDVPDFPKKGIIFKDITTLLKDKAALKKTIDVLATEFAKKKIKYVVGIESRGFIFGTALAYKLGVGFVPIRKKGKLPAKTRAVTYDLEYGTDTLEIHEDALKAGDRVLIVDDLLATGGTVQAVVKLVRGLGAKITGIGFVIELSFLNGREKLPGLPVFSIIRYE
ncbi:MAG: adenine phosphoribosyltransferase [Candidatus Omnitrophica bacterium]|nr:adenine phosphoribosyltransferase [Candidatus Omnitrophota bacterium]